VQNDVAVYYRLKAKPERVELVTIRFQCRCGKRFRVAADQAGQRAKCWHDPLTSYSPGPQTLAYRRLADRFLTPLGAETSIGCHQTIITHATTWKPSTTTLPDPEMKTKGMDTYAYLVRMVDKAADITLSNMTLRGPQLHGAVYGWGNQNLHLDRVRIQDTLWAGVRTFKMTNAKIHDCEFIDAAGRWKRGGQPGVDGGITGGAIFTIWMTDSEISHNRFVRTQMDKADEFCGIKGRQGRRCRIHHNTIEVDFSIEFPLCKPANRPTCRSRNTAHISVRCPRRTHRRWLADAPIGKVTSRNRQLAVCRAPVF
jgi:hypothetical protein